MRVLPWVIHQKRLEGAEAVNCERCMESNNETTRLAMRCGFLPPSLYPRSARAFTLGLCTLEPEVCPGYTIRLPQVQATAEAWQWWEKNQLSTWLDGDPPSPLLKQLILVFGGEYQTATDWAMERKRQMAGT